MQRKVVEDKSMLRGVESAELFLRKTGFNLSLLCPHQDGC
jgi:hypothetical protein